MQRQKIYDIWQQITLNVENFILISLYLHVLLNEFLNHDEKLSTLVNTPLSFPTFNIHLQEVKSWLIFSVLGWWFYFSNFRREVEHTYIFTISLNNLKLFLTYSSQNTWSPVTTCYITSGYRRSFFFHVRFALAFMWVLPFLFWLAVWCWKFAFGVNI